MLNANRIDPGSGLFDADLNAIAAACANFAQVRTAILFGSRAKGNYRNGSDVDIALEVDGDGYDLCLALADYLNEETLMPYHFDVIDLAAVDNVELLDHVSRQGRELYRRPANKRR